MASQRNDLKFTQDLYNKLRITNENIIISPLLIESLLSLLYLGSDGLTADKLKTLLELEKFENNSKMAIFFESHLNVITADMQSKCLLNNSLFITKNIELSAEFKKIAQKYFYTTVYPILVDIDNNGHRNSEKLIEDALKKITIPYKHTNEMKLSTSSEIVENNAFIMTAGNLQYKWFLPFSVYRTGLYEFHNDNIEGGDHIKLIPMLYDDDMFVKFIEVRELNARIIELPFEHDDELAMLIVLPNARDGLPQLLDKLQHFDLTTLSQQMQVENVQVLLPKFTMNFQCNLSDYMLELLSDSVFSKQSNFKNLLHDNGKGSLHLADVFCAVNIAVNETGSDESTVPIIKPIVISNSIDSKKKFFRADHPFYFVIHNGFNKYFIGHVSKL